jgi:hypothetical protein
MPNKEIDDPKRAKLLSDRLDPNCTKSKTDRAEPKSVMPNTEIPEPRRAKLRRDKVLPKLKKSNKDMDDPTVVIL